MMMRFQALIKPGRSIAQRLLSRCNERTRRNVGMRPPLKNIVNTTRIIMCFFQYALLAST